MKEPLPVEQIFEYEVLSTWWACRLRRKFLQNLAGRYLSWKLSRKYRRYVQAKMVAQKMTEMERLLEELRTGQGEQ